MIRHFTKNNYFRLSVNIKNVPIEKTVVKNLRFAIEKTFLHWIVGELKLLPLYGGYFE